MEFRYLKGGTSKSSSLFYPFENTCEISENRKIPKFTLSLFAGIGRGIGSRATQFGHFLTSLLYCVTAHAIVFYLSLENDYKNY